MRVETYAFALRRVRVVFGAGAIVRLGDELSRAGLSRPFLLATPGRAGDVTRLEGLLPAVAGQFRDARLHVPATTVAAACSALRQTRADCCVALGGGSAIGLGKALARETGLPLAALPTTYSGSEMTDIWGLTEDGHKQTGRDIRAAPSLVVYDPDLTRTLPAGVSAESGMNAIAHAVEALYAPDRHPLASLAAAAAIERLARALPAIARAPGDVHARHDALEGAYLAGLALGLTTMGLHHKLCHTLGGAFDLPHAATHAVLLPHVVAYNRTAAPDAMRTIAQALRATDAADALFALSRELPVARSLQELGLDAEDLERAAEMAVRVPYPNPRPVSRESVLALLRSAHGS